MRDDIVDRITAANLPATTFRTAIWLLRLSHPANGYVRLSHDEMAVFCGTDKVATVRAHLVQLAAADLITYRRNSAVHVFWHHWTPEVIAQTSNSRAQTAGRALSDHDDEADREKVIAQTSNSRAQRSPDLNADLNVIAQTSNSRAQTAERALSDHDLTRADPVSSLVSQSIDHELTNELSPEPEPEPERNNHQPSAAEIDQSLALLTDPEVGLDVATAHAFAAANCFEWLLCQVMTWRRQLDAGKVRGSGALIARIRNRFGCTLTVADKRTKLYRRHMAVDDDGSSEADRHRKYIPAEYADIIIG